MCDDAVIARLRYPLCSRTKLESARLNRRTWQRQRTAENIAVLKSLCSFWLEGFQLWENSWIRSQSMVMSWGLQFMCPLGLSLCSTKVALKFKLAQCMLTIW
jgi:hypothetical protein